MQLRHAAFIVLLIAPVLVAAQENLGTYEDRIAVEDVMARYVWAVDSLDPEGYVAVFTEDTVIDSNGSISKGHEEIRKIVTNLIKRRDDNRAKGLPTSNLYHVISNVRITFPKTDRLCISRTGRLCAVTRMIRWLPPRWAAPKTI